MKEHRKWIEVMGGPQAVADQLGLKTRNVVQNWLERGISYKALVEYQPYWKKAARKAKL